MLRQERRSSAVLTGLWVSLKCPILLGWSNSTVNLQPRETLSGQGPRNYHGSGAADRELFGLAEAIFNQGDNRLQSLFFVCTIGDNIELGIFYRC